MTNAQLTQERVFETQHEAAQIAGRLAAEQSNEATTEYTVQIVHGEMWFTRKGRTADWASVKGTFTEDGQLTVEAWVSPFCSLPASAFERACENRVHRNAEARLRGAN